TGEERAARDQDLRHHPPDGIARERGRPAGLAGPGQGIPDAQDEQSCKSHRYSHEREIEEGKACAPLRHQLLADQEVGGGADEGTETAQKGREADRHQDATLVEQRQAAHARNHRKHQRKGTDVVHEDGKNCPVAQRSVTRLASLSAASGRGARRRSSRPLRPSTCTIRSISTTVIKAGLAKPPKVSASGTRPRTTPRARPPSATISIRSRPQAKSPSMQTRRSTIAACSKVIVTRPC